MPRSTVLHVKRTTADPGWRRLQVRTVARDYRPPQHDQEDAGADPDPVQDEVGRYGGDLGRQLPAIGFYRVEQVDGRWWLIDPEGHPFFRSGVNSVSPQAGPQSEAAMTAAGGMAAWREQTRRWLGEHRFNTLGMWSEPGIAAEDQVDAEPGAGPQAPRQARVHSDFSLPGDPVSPRPGRPLHGLMTGFTIDQLRAVKFRNLTPVN